MVEVLVHEDGVIQVTAGRCVFLVKYRFRMMVYIQVMACRVYCVKILVQDDGVYPGDGR